MIAVRDNDSARVQEILTAVPGQKKASINLANNEGFRAIHYATVNGTLEILNLLTSNLDDWDIFNGCPTFFEKQAKGEVKAKTKQDYKTVLGTI